MSVGKSFNFVLVKSLENFMPLIIKKLFWQCNVHKRIFIVSISFLGTEI